jgi:hypothetical protein
MSTNKIVLREGTFPAPQDSKNSVLVGHCAIALAGKRAEPALSLGTLMAAAVLSDLLGFVLILAGVEHWTFKPGLAGINAVDLDRIAWSHGLLPNLLWAAAFAGGYFLLRRRPRESWFLFAAVLSHWVLDFVSHRADMPLTPGLTTRWGLGLWTSVPATLVVEGLLWLIALAVYVRATRSTKRAGIYGFWLMIAFLTLSWVNNITATPPAGSLTVAAITSLTFFTLLVVWAYWMDRVRKLAV